MEFLSQKDKELLQTSDCEHPQITILSLHAESSRVYTLSSCYTTDIARHIGTSGLLEPRNERVDCKGLG